MLKIILYAAVLIIAALGASAFIFQEKIGSALFARAIEQRVGVDHSASLKDGLHVGLCGTGSPLPNPERAGPCTIVIAGEQIYVVDIGEGGARNLNLMALPANKIAGVFLTHFHSDHIDGLGPLMLFHWTQGASQAPLPIYGPPGVEAVVAGFNAAYAIDHRYRIAHHGEKIVPSTGGGGEARPFDLAGTGAGAGAGTGAKAETSAREQQVVLEKDGLRVTAFTVNHAPISPALGYRFDYKGRSVVISGDTAKSQSLERAAKGADLLIHDALQSALTEKITAALEKNELANAATITRDIVTYHASPEDAADAAQRAGVGLLILSHLVPPVPGRYFYPAFLGSARDRFDGSIIVGEDGMFFSLPAGETSIEKRQLL